MKRFYVLLISLMMMFSLSSCEMYTYATTQDDIYVEAEADVVYSNVSFDIILQYGTPFYRDGILLYYLYKDIYYYPFYYDNYWYVRAYRRPFTHFDHRPYFRPHRHDHRFKPGDYRGFDRPRSHYKIAVPHNNPRHHDGHIRPNRPMNNRPDIQPRNSRPEFRLNRNIGGNNRRIDSRQGNQPRNRNFGGRR